MSTYENHEDTVLAPRVFETQKKATTAFINPFQTFSNSSNTPITPSVPEVEVIEGQADDEQSPAENSLLNISPDKEYGKDIALSNAETSSLSEDAKTAVTISSTSVGV